MKKLELKTSKGTFFLLDGDSDGRIQLPTDIEYQELGRVKNMTEEQFSEVVDSRIKGGGLLSHPREKCFKDYMNGGYPRGVTAFYSLKTLVKSLGWYLYENPYQDPGLIPSAELDRYRKTNDKIFFNPILLKKI